MIIPYISLILTQAREAQKAKDNGEWVFEPKQYKYKTIDANDGTDC